MYPRLANPHKKRCVCSPHSSISITPPSLLPLPLWTHAARLREEDQEGAGEGERARQAGEGEADQRRGGRRQAPVSGAQPGGGRGGAPARRRRRRASPGAEWPCQGRPCHHPRAPEQRRAAPAGGGTSRRVSVCVCKYVNKSVKCYLYSTFQNLGNRVLYKRIKEQQK